MRGWDSRGLLERINYKEWRDLGHSINAFILTPLKTKVGMILRPRLQNLFIKKMDHSGVLLDLPDLPNVRQSLSNDGRIHKDDRMLCQSTAEKASAIIVQSALDQFRTNWIEDIERNGLEAVKTSSLNLWRIRYM
jgi:hypothetical protein